MKGFIPLRVGLVILSAAMLIALAATLGGAAFVFPHPKHIEAAECATCHPGAAESSSGKEDLIPQTSVCLDCHSQEDLTGYGWTGPPKVSFDLPKFSHKQHLALPEVDCARCHAAIERPALAGTEKGQIGHPVCFGCHDGAKAPNDCADCHENVAQLRPLDHEADYRHTHQFSARASAGDCEKCHRSSDKCSECHYGENVLYRTHGRNYVYTHAVDARKNENDCVSCHTAETFCNDCHRSEGIRPTNHLRNWTTGANLHAAEARRDINYCAACHSDAEPLCARCHRDQTPGKGNDPSIHPSTFDQYGVHGPWHGDPSYYCFDCHTRSTAPDGFCGYCHSPQRGD